MAGVDLRVECFPGAASSAIPLPRHEGAEAQHRRSTRENLAPFKARSARRRRIGYPLLQVATAKALDASACSTQELGHGTNTERREVVTPLLDGANHLAFFETVEIVSLLTQNPAQADQFVRRALGDLATAPRDLQQAVSAPTFRTSADRPSAG
ncbi:hypothetical protein [Streptomyces sp. CB01635]|uniref:hypothetical protein n=1 Tax=unclassified Streptomyces TaxID=2593676 RepID=UPI0018FE227B|nr:hypothetical protein [Streptomyces sp. CB01635]